MSAAPQFGDFLRFCHVGPASDRRYRFSAAEDARIRREYPFTPTDALAAAMGRSAASIAVRASKLGIHKAQPDRAPRVPRKTNGGDMTGPKIGTYRREQRIRAEDEKRARLRAEVRALCETPLNPSAEPLSEDEREEIRTRVRAAKRYRFPGGIKRGAE